MKKLLGILLAATLTLGMTACGNKPQDAATPTTTGDKCFRIGILQLAEHEALSAACRGFLAGLTDAGLVEGKDYTVDLQNANGDQTLCSTIAGKFVSEGVDLILAIATPAAQAAATATSEIPILVTAVTDPAGSGLVASNEAPGGNVSGSSDMVPVDKQIDLLLKLAPSAKSVGILYSSGEDNSLVQVKAAQKALEALGKTVVPLTAADSSEVQAVAQSATDKVQAVYIPTDNLMADTMPAISAILTPAGIPTVPGADTMVKDGGTATYGLNYEQLGRQTGAMAVEILKNGADISTMPIQYCSTDLALTVNDELLAQLGITLPAEVK